MQLYSWVRRSSLFTPREKVSHVIAFAFYIHQTFKNTIIIIITQFYICYNPNSLIVLPFSRFNRFLYILQMFTTTFTLISALFHIEESERTVSLALWCSVISLFLLRLKKIVKGLKIIKAIRNGLTDLIVVRKEKIDDKTIQGFHWYFSKQITGNRLSVNLIRTLSCQVVLYPKGSKNISEKRHFFFYVVFRKFSDDFFLFFNSKLGFKPWIPVVSIEKLNCPQHLFKLAICSIHIGCLYYAKQSKWEKIKLVNV